MAVQRNPEKVFEQSWRTAGSASVQRMALYLVLALLVMTAVVSLTRPLAQAHFSGTQARILALAGNVRGGGVPPRSSSRSMASAHIVRVTGVVRLSTGAGGGCHASDISATVQSGNTLSGIAAHYGLTWTHLASYNHLTDPNLILPGQTLCVPTSASINTQVSPLVTNTPAAIPQTGHVNLFPYGQCTWWANQRYFQLHGVYVPWSTQSDAWQWTARARDFGWQVSATPQMGDIVDLQPWVQGAYGLGHVAVVERILGNGDVLASNMNWGTTPGMVVNVEFTPGAGVTFIRL